MCGICGEIKFNGSLASVSVVEKMLGQLARRGPDGSGVFAQGPIAFGQRRLKIIDLSEHAQQPMVDNQLGLGVVYNGAIYNYPQLRAQLQEEGYQFFSTGDTEVILKAYHAWGEEFVRRLSGMFAFVLWERDSGRVLLCRDRLGIKPLYYTLNTSSLRFASSLPALAHLSQTNTEIDKAALHFYLSLHSVVPAPYTILQGVRKLPAATLMVIEKDGRQRQHNYWQLSFQRSAEETKRNFVEWKEILLESLQTAIRRRLLADVPVGVLLSGGLDSSLVVGLLHKFAQHSINTFSIGFESVGKEAGNEFIYSDVIAQHFSTKHTKIHISAQETLNALDETVGAMSEPMVSHDNVGFYLLAKEVAKHVKVVESGQGADEVFAGYHWYPPMMESQNPVHDYAEVFLDRSHAEFCSVVHPRFIEENYTLDLVAQHFAKPKALLAIDKTLRIDTEIMLVDDPVKRVDNMTMAWGLEARVPFLDHELVELAALIPPELKVKNSGKYILKEIAREIIPQQVIDRPKGYFPVPALKFLQGEFFHRVRDILSQPVAQKRELFEPEYVAQLLQSPNEHITPLQGSKLWQLGLLEFWLQTHGFG